MREYGIRRIFQNYNLKKRIKDLNLIDNFLFGTVVDYPGMGEEFVRLLLKTIFNRNFGKLQIVPEKEYKGVDTDLHGVRLDVYVEAASDDNAKDVSVIDIEPEKNDKEKDVKTLPKRTRYYHSKIDAIGFESGKAYRYLKEAIVVMIMSFDPFGRDRTIYTIRNMCQEEPDIPYDDGARTIYLYTKGTRGRSRKKLRELLCYMEKSNEDNAVNPELRKLHHMVEKVKMDKGVSLKYMKYLEQQEMIREEGREEGRKEEMVNTERERLRAEAAEQKNQEIVFSNIKNLMRNLGFTAEQAMQALNISEAYRRLFRAQL
ncbi:MAG: Rpn family recombination-promoting nuclease/putative transposase [Lachnospiraceae bacterium]|nr:Rpn family recombination-promoting nuclease/putative transposase [Lachnospiraceae bacterium]